MILVDVCIAYPVPACGNCGGRLVRHERTETLWRFSCWSCRLVIPRANVVELDLILFDLSKRESDDKSSG